jgi:hypothetical protein
MEEKYDERKNVSFFCANFIQVTGDTREDMHVGLHFITARLYPKCKWFHPI